MRAKAERIELGHSFISLSTIYSLQMKWDAVKKKYLSDKHSTIRVNAYCDKRRDNKTRKIQSIWECKRFALGHL